MKTIYYGILFFIISSSSAQEVLESVQPLSNKARKGYLYDAAKDNNGNTDVIFKMNIDKKSDAVAFEKYSFDKNGIFKAQYGIGKVNDDKKSMLFRMYQNFYPSLDGKSIYLELMEVKGMKGYDSFSNAYYGYATFSAHYYPRITRIDLDNNSLSPIKVLGNGKYFLNDIYARQFDEKENSILYVGMDKDYENLWVGKMIMQ